MSRNVLIPIFSIAMLIGASSPALAAGPAVIEVELSDRAADAATGLVLDVEHPGLEVKMAMLKIEATPQVVAAGTVTFKVKNSSGAMIHEMVVARVADPESLPTYDKATGRVDEEAVASLGEVPELEPGMSGSLSLELVPGTYILFCNLPGHYMAGMWSLIDVR
jgi:uncharacterized cupredoxin-like copper-binding protein